MKASILIIGPAHPLRGGLASFNERLARQFVQEEHPTQIFTFSLQYPGFLFPGTTQFSSEPTPNDIEICKVINSINPLNWLIIGNRIKKLKPDIIVVRYWLPFMGPCLGTILRLAKLNKHTSVVCIADNIIPHENRLGDKIFTRYFVKPIDAFITMSDKVMLDLKLFSKKPSQKVIHPLYDNFGEAIRKAAAKEYLKIPNAYQVVLFFGFIRKYKGLDLLLAAIYELKKQNYFETHGLKFLIAGEFYESSQPYFDLIKEYDIAEQLILKTEFIADSEIKYYLSCADCVIQPYKQATQSGVTPLAYHFEKPMIVTNVGGLPALVPETVGLICEPNATAIANAITNFYKQDLQQFENNIKEEKKKYGWDKITQAILSLARIQNSL